MFKIVMIREWAWKYYRDCYIMRLGREKSKKRNVVVFLIALPISKTLESFWLLLTPWSCECVNWVSQRVTNKFLDYNMLLNGLSLLNIEIHNANKGQTTADFFILRSSQTGQVAFVVPMRRLAGLSSVLSDCLSQGNCRWDRRFPLLLS